MTSLRLLKASVRRSSGWLKMGQMQPPAKLQPKRQPLDQLSGRVLEIAQASEQERNGAR